jgi:hypothetical protein
LKEFTNSHFSKQDTPSFTADRLNELGAIIISGENSPDSPSFSRIRDIATRVFPDHQDKIRDTIDPHYVGAVGAAQRARHFIEDPSMLEDPNDRYFGDIHDEL